MPPATRSRGNEASQVARNVPGLHGLDGLASAQLHHRRRALGTHFDDWPEEEIDENDVVIFNALHGHRRFVYEYDFGDSWEHEVVVEDITWTPLVLKHAVCLDGQNACPPEDVGGVGGYAEFLEAIADPRHEEYDHFLRWAGFHFDPGAFELAGANAALQRVR